MLSSVDVTAVTKHGCSWKKMGAGPVSSAGVAGRVGQGDCKVEVLLGDALRDLGDSQMETSLLRSCLSFCALMLFPPFGR